FLPFPRPSRPRATWSGSSQHRSASASPASERDHAAAPVLTIHQLEAALHVVEGHTVREERVDVDLACEPAVDELRHLRPTLHNTRTRPRAPPAGDEESGDDLERLPLARDAAHRG